MKDGLRHYIDAARSLAERRGIPWSPEAGPEGKAEWRKHWRLDAMANLPKRGAAAISFRWTTKDRQSKARLAKKLAAKQEEVECLTAQRDLLAASHKAMILAVGEMGGPPAWRKFFQRYRSAIDQLSTIGALPTADPHILGRGEENDD